MTKKEYNEWNEYLDKSVKEYSEEIKKFSNEDLMDCYERLNYKLNDRINKNPLDIFVQWYQGAVEATREEILSRMK
jgi:hypothetical protein